MIKSCISHRSHAIFTVTLEQRKLVPPSTGQSEAVRQGSSDESGDEEGDSEGEEDGMEEDIGFLCAKLHLVDLAGRLADQWPVEITDFLVT